MQAQHSSVPASAWAVTSLLLAVLILLPDLISYTYRLADAVGLNPDLIAAQISVESKWRVDAVSPTGAHGIAQIMPKFHPHVNTDDPYSSIYFLVTSMDRYVDKYGSYLLALAAYNAGEPTVDACQCVPWEETRRYVERVTTRAGTRPVEIE